MNDVQKLIDRQLGFQCRLEYDSALRRLAVRADESYYGLAAAEAARVPDPADQDPPIFACRFAETAGYEHILALANEDGRVAIQDTRRVGGGSLEGFQCHNNAVFDLAWRPHHMNFVTVSGDHTACLWDVSEGGPRRVLMFSHHTRSVKTAVFQPAGGVFATGARDGHVLVWDVRAGGMSGQQPSVVLRPDNCLLSCHSSFAPKTPGSHGKRARLDAPRAASVTGLAFRDDLTLLSCGECDGNIKVWDLRKNYTTHKREPLPKHSIPYCGSSSRNGYTNLVVDEARVRLYASCMDSVIYCFNIATCHALPERRYVGHENATFYIKACLSPDNRYLVSGSSDKSAYVWSVRRARPLVRLAGHRAEVTAAAWGRGADAPLATCSDDARHKLWRLRPEADDAGAEDWLAGRAEVLPRDEPLALPPWGLRTPLSLKRRALDASAGGGGGGGKRAREHAPRRTKRCLAALMADMARDDAAPGKRMRPEDSGALLPAGTKRKSTGAEAEADAGSPRRPRRDSSPVATAGPSGAGYEKRGCKRLSPRSPRPKVSSPSKAGGSLTTVVAVAVASGASASRALWAADLPDFVRTGEAPHLRLMSPQKPRRVAPDWLTQLRRSRARDAPAPAPTQAPATAALSLSPSPSPARRPSLTDKPPRAKNTKTLLKYFSVADK